MTATITFNASFTNVDSDDELCDIVADLPNVVSYTLLPTLSITFAAAAPLDALVSAFDVANVAELLDFATIS